MVTLRNKYWVLLLLSLPEAGTCLDFYMEASKKDFYQGENVSVSFILSGKTDSADVEVGKFPEFRSFWSENTVLRQGPIPLLSAGNAFDPGAPFIPQLPFQELVKRFRAQRSNVERKAIIGTYIITAMIGREDLKIEPMKILARDSLNRTQSPVTLESRMPDLTIRRLPVPPPSAMTSFRGAVGAFTLEAEQPEVRHRPGEAGNLRLILRGEGNYPEINEIPIGLPRGVKLLSHRSQMLQTGQENSKTFEYTISIADPTIQELGPFSITYFHPIQNRFVSAVTPKVKVVFVEPIESPKMQTEILELPLYEKETPARPLFLSTISLLFQGLLFLGLCAHMFILHLQKLNRKKHQALSFIRRHKVEQIKKVFQSGDAETASRDLTQLLEELLEKDLSPELFLSRSHKLRLVEKTLGFEARQTIEKYMSEHDHSRFSKEKAPTPSLEIHLQKLTPVLDKLCG